MAEALVWWLTKPDAIVWWLTLELIGAAAFPIVFLYFRFLPDRGYGFSKVLALLLMTYLLWMGASTHIIPNTRWSIALILFVILTVSVILAFHLRRDLFDYLRANWRYLIFVELFFTAAFAIALFLRSHTADTTLFYHDNVGHQAFINTILRSRYFPPEDPWLSGNPINYYYFGHLIVATLTKLTSIPSGISFNLAFASVPALLASAAFSLVYNLVAFRSKAVIALIFGLIGAIFLTVLSNIVGVFELLAVNGIGSSGFYSFLDIQGLEGTRDSPFWYPAVGDSWETHSIIFRDGEWDNQFPFYQFLTGALMKGIPFLPLILVFAAALNIWLIPDSMFRSLNRTYGWRFGLTALVAGAAIVTHTWDAPIAILSILLVVVLKSYSVERRFNSALVFRIGTFALLFVPLALLLYAPFFRISTATFDGIGILGGERTTEPKHLLYMWLPLLWLAGSMAVVSLGKIRPPIRVVPLAVVPILLPLIPWAVVAIVDGGLDRLQSQVDERGLNWISIAILASVLTAISLAVAGQLASRNGEKSKIVVFPLILGGAAVLILAGVEFFWVRDATRSCCNELNTVYKANHQAWILLGITAAFSAYYVMSVWRTPRPIPRFLKATWASVTVALIVAGLVFPVIATFSHTRDFSAPLYPSSGLSAGRGLDGLVGLHPSQYRAFEFLRDEVEGTPVILEAVADSYSDYGFVSAFTGLPTVLGWKTHEFWWRGSNEPFAGREEDIQRIYSTPDPDVAKALMDKYDVEYVYIGWREKRDYGEAYLGKFAGFMDVIYDDRDIEFHEVTIYKLRDEGDQQAATDPADLGARP